MNLKLFSALLVLPMLCLAQGRGKYNSNYTIRGNLGIPKPLSSQMFSRSFTSIYEVNVSFNARLFENFYAGLGYQNTQLQNNKKVFVLYTPPNNPDGQLSYDTRLLANAVFLKLGYDQFITDKRYVSYSLNSGLMFARYLNVVQDSAVENQPFVPTNFSCPFLQPEISINFIVEPRLSFCLMMSYTTLLYHYDPKAPRFAHFGEIKSASNNYVMSWLNFGFGFNVLLGKKR